MEGIEKIMCFDKPSDSFSNSLAAASLMNNGMGGNGWNNPFMYLIWLAMFNGGNGFGFGNNAGNAMQGNELMNQINSLRQQIGDNQLNNVAMDAIKGNRNAIANLATSLNCDFNQLSTGLCNVRSAIEQVGGQVGFTSERVINAVSMGNAAITSKLQDCCCGMKTAVLEQGYQSQLALERQTNTLGRDIEAFQAQSQLQNCQNTSAITQAVTNLGYQLQQHKCEIVESGTANTQRILDALNGHWQAETALALQDEKFKNSQLMQNQFIASLINGQTAAAKASSNG